MSLPRSYLFVPGDRADRFGKALASGTHAIIIDLEDAVAPSDKSAARDATANWLAAHSSDKLERVWIRINAVTTLWYAEDLDLVAQMPIAGIVLPKAEDVESVGHTARRLGFSQRLLPLIETAEGIANARAIARLEKVDRLVFGSLDLQLDLGMQCDANEAELASYRAEVVLASRLGQVAAPVDGVTVALDDPAQLERDIDRAARQGFAAKLCIHPKQVEAVNAGFAPSAEEVQWAQRVLDAVQSSRGAVVAMDGKMIDAPLIALARRILSQTS